MIRPHSYNTTIFAARKKNAFCFWAQFIKISPWNFSGGNIPPKIKMIWYEKLIINKYAVHIQVQNQHLFLEKKILIAYVIGSERRMLSSRGSRMYIFFKLEEIQKNSFQIKTHFKYHSSKMIDKWGHLAHIYVLVVYVTCKTSSHDSTTWFFR